MALFQTSVLKSKLSMLNEAAVEKAYKKYKTYFLNTTIQENIKSAKEEQFQATFLHELFVNILGYTLFPNPNSNLTTEFKNEKNNRKADGAILRDGVAIGVIELKGMNTKDLESIRQQAFDYKANHKECVYVVTSNFEKLRFYINDATEFEEFDLFTLSRERFDLLYLCLHINKVLTNIPLSIKEASIAKEEEITKTFYKDYSVFKRELYRDLVRRNSKTVKEKLSTNIDEEDQIDITRLEKNVKLNLFKKSQKLIDRFLFVFFAEDRNLLPSNSTLQILNKWKDDQDFGDDRPLYDLFKQYFNFLDTGRKGTQNRAEIYAYNGGLFKPDAILDALEIDSELLYKHTLALSNYDFESQVDVNILGHIFENSLNEIESVNSEIEGGDFDKQTSKRKKDGVFYTPKYITKYIVENTVGKLCIEKKEELGFEEEQYFKSRKKRNKDTLKGLVQILDDYRDWLLELTICDPACGSGAFLNQALDFLIKEHSYIDELKARVLGGGLQFPDIENTILENNIYGVDLNDESVEIAKLSLWLRTAQPRRKLNDLSSNVKCGNSLIDDKKVAGDKAFNWEKEFPDVFEKGGFDVVIGNPPYVVYISSIFGKATLDYINNKFKYSEYNPNTYALFTDLTLNSILKINGFLGFIIPNSWLEGQYFSKMRKDIYGTQLEEIVYLKNTVFAEVVETVIVHVRNIKNSPSIVKLTNDIIDNDFLITGFEGNKYINGFNPFTSTTNPLVQRLEKDFDKLKNHAIVYRGLETRNNKVWLSEEKKDDNYLPILLGRDVNRYDIEYTGSYVNFIQKEMKSNANLEMYLQPKILMRRTGSNIIATKDENNLMVLKNSYLIIPDDINKLDSLLAQLNSSLFGYFHKSKTSAENKAFAQFKGTYILDFPANFNMKFDFSKPVNQTINLNQTLTKLKSTFISFFSGQYSILKITRTLEYWYSLTFSNFIKELNKAIKSTNKERAKEELEPIPTLTKKDEFEWMELFEENKKKAVELQGQIDSTEKEIDEMVYELYGLSEEEIRIVEGS